MLLGSREDPPHEPHATTVPPPLGGVGRLGEGASFLIETLRVRPAARRILSGVSVMLAVIGVGLLAYPSYTNFYQDRLQTKLAIEFKKAGDQAGLQGRRDAPSATPSPGSPFPPST